MSPDAGVVIPLRAFVDGKSRLAPYLDQHDRERLLEAMADRVVAAASPHPVVVITSAPEVESWAERHDLEVIADPGNLDDAARAGVEFWRSRNAGRIVIAHADLPLVESLTPLAAPGTQPTAVVVPCHRDDGTPLLSLPSPVDFPFSYGPGSFERHVAAAERAGLDVLVLTDDPTLRQDVDSIDDLELLTQLTS